MIKNGVATASPSSSHPPWPCSPPCLHRSPTWRSACPTRGTRGSSSGSGAPPLPAWVYMAGRICSGVWVAVLSVGLMFVLGWAFFGFHMIWTNLGTALVVFVVGIATFSALGLAVCAVLRERRFVPGRHQRGIPADGLRLGDLHPAGRCAAVAGDSGRCLPAEALRRTVP